MAIYCSDEDCRLIYADWGSLSGTDGTAIRTEASAMFDAFLGDFAMSPPLPSSGTNYDYYVRKATCNLAVWLALRVYHGSSLLVGHAHNGISGGDGGRSGEFGERFAFDDSFLHRDNGRLPHLLSRVESA